MVREVQETLKTMEPTTVAFSCLPEVDSKSLSLKTPCTLETGLGRLELDLT